MGTTNFDTVAAGSFVGDVAGDVTVVNAIDATSLATAEKVLNVPDVASGGVLAAHVTDAMTHSLRFQSADGTVYYLMATTTVSNRTGGA